MNKDLMCTNFDIEEVEVLIKECIEENLPCDVLDGSLLDNYIIYNIEDMTFDGEKINRKYAIIEEVYLNTWSSDYKITFTDDLDKVEEFIKEMERVYDAINEDYQKAIS